MSICFFIAQFFGIYSRTASIPKPVKKTLSQIQVHCILKQGIMQPAGYDHTPCRVATTSGRKQNNLPYSTQAVAANARMEERPANSRRRFCLICNSLERCSISYCMVVSSLARNTIMAPGSDHLLPQSSLYSTYYYCMYYSYVSDRAQLALYFSSLTLRNRIFCPHERTTCPLAKDKPNVRYSNTIVP